MPLHRDDPKSVGGYKLVDRLGAGGMGVVYRGRSRSGRDVAVKVVHAQYAEDAVFRTRFRQEIEAVRRVSGAFTAPVVDADPEAARPWMATQYVPGRSLAQRIRERGELRGAELRQLALGLVEALREIHRAGVVHRDLKPANVLMAEDGPRVIDFGISRAAENHTLTETGQMIGTPPFMSPEQLTDARTVGPASDVFSLGALLVYATTGRGPFDADSPYLTAYRVVHDQPVLDGVPQPLRAVLERCLAKEAADRPGLDQLAQEFATVLPEADAGDAETVTLRRDVPGPARPARTAAAPDADPSGRGGRVRPLWAATGTVAALVLGLTAYLLIGPGQAESQDTLPDGWRPWQTTVHETAARGAKNPLVEDDSGTDSGPDCQAYEGSVYCVGDGVLPVRLNGVTGETVWRADLARPGTERGTYSTQLLGVRGGTMVVQQLVSSGDGDSDAVSVVALDTGHGGRLWSRPVPETNADTFYSGDLVVIPDPGGRTVTARSARSGAERWTGRLPADYCGFTEADGTLYAQCIPDGEEPKDSLVLAFNAADGSTRRLTAPYNAGLAGALDGRLLFLQWGGTDDELQTDQPYVRIVRVDPGTGARTTTKLAKGYVGHATLADDTLWFVASSGEVTAVSAHTGKPLWRTPTSLEQPGEARYDRRTRALYMTTPTGRVAAVDAREGKVLWETLPRAGATTSSGWNDPKAVLVEGALVIALPDGTVFALDPADPERKPVPG